MASLRMLRNEDVPCFFRPGRAVHARTYFIVCGCLSSLQWVQRARQRRVRHGGVFTIA